MLGLFSGEPIFGGAYYWEEFCVSKWVGLVIKRNLKHYENSLKRLKTGSTNSPWANIWEGLLSETFLRLRFGGLIIGILQYLSNESTEILIHAFISSRIDYYNSVLYGLPACQLQKLQRVQNSAARLMCLKKPNSLILHLY